MEVKIDSCISFFAAFDFFKQWKKKSHWGGCCPPGPPAGAAHVSHEEHCDPQPCWLSPPRPTSWNRPITFSYLIKVTVKCKSGFRTAWRRGTWDAAFRTCPAAHSPCCTSQPAHLHEHRTTAQMYCRKCSWPGTATEDPKKSFDGPCAGQATTKGTFMT